MALINKVLPGFVATLWCQSGANPTPLTDAELSTWADVEAIIGTSAGGLGTGGIQLVVEAKLATLSERLGFKDQSNVKCQCLVSGNARQDFLNYVEKLGCDLIITASQEKTLMRGIFEGSFASYLNKYARPNLLVLRPA